VIALRDNARGTVPRAVASGSPRDRNPVATARGTVPCVTTGGWLKLGGVVFFSSSPAVYSWDGWDKHLSPIYRASSLAWA